MEIRLHSLECCANSQYAALYWRQRSSSTHISFVALLSFPVFTNFLLEGAMAAGGMR